MSVWAVSAAATAAIASALMIGFGKNDIAVCVSVIICFLHGSSHAAKLVINGGNYVKGFPFLNEVSDLYRLQ